MIEYTEELKKIFKYSEEEAKKLNSRYVDTEHFILSVLKKYNKLSLLLKETYNLTYEMYLKELKSEIKEEEYTGIYSSNIKKVIDNACYYDKNNKKPIIDIDTIFLSILENDQGLGIEILENLNINLKELYISLKEQVENTINPFIKEVGINLNLKAKANEFEQTIGRKKELTKIMEILARKNKNNPILVGKAGVGKTAIVEELSRRIINKNVPSFLLNTNIISINMSNLVAGTKYRGEFEEKLNKIIKELETDKNTIIFIDEIHTLVGAGGAEGAIDASNILKPALARGKLRCIGATTLSEYKKCIEKDKALDRRFQKIYVEEPNELETLTILKKIKKDYEKYHNVKINNDILEKIVKLSKKYIKTRYEPDRSIDILDEVCAKASIKDNNIKVRKLLNKKEKVTKLKNQHIKNKQYIYASKLKEEENNIDNNIKKIKNKNNINEVTLNDLKLTLESKSNSYIKELNNNLNVKNIKENIKEKILGQNAIIEKVLDIIKNKTIDKKPLSLLFIGSTGVGKTFLAKELNKELKYNFIKLDMSEYSFDMSINKIIGSAQGYVGYEDVNTVFEVVKDKPNSLILLDNIEESSDKVLNLLLKVIDEGYLTNSKGEEIYFNNCIFVLTTKNNNINNLGFIIKGQKQSNSYLENKINYSFYFNDLKRKDIEELINKKLKEKNKILTKEEINKLIEESNYKKYGARKLDILVEKKINKNNVYI